MADNAEPVKPMPAMDGYTTLKSNPDNILERELEDPHLQSMQQRLYKIETDMLIPPSQKEAMIQSLYRELMESHFDTGNKDGATKPVPQPSEKPPTVQSKPHNPPQLPGGPKFGAITTNYSWDQDEFEVLVRIPVDSSVTGKQVDWLLKADKIRVALKQTDQVFLDGELFANVNVDDCHWQFEKDVVNGGKLVLITLAKVKKTFGPGHWNCVVKGGDTVDTSQWAEEHMKVFGDR